MSVPANILSELANLTSQIKAANPIKAAPFATQKAIQLNARQLETDLTVALNTAAGLLDTWVANRDSPSIVSGYNIEVGSARDQWRMFEMLTFVGRVHLNVDLVIGEVKPPLKND